MMRWGDGRVELTPKGIAELNAFLPTIPTLIRILDVLLAHPDLTGVGFANLMSADFDAARLRLSKNPGQFDRAYAWLQRVPRTVTPTTPRATIYPPSVHKVSPDSHQHDVVARGE
jgi:hypothetical protein